MEKIERDGKIAVLYSPGYGAGWSTWSGVDNQEAMLMDARIVGAFLEGGVNAVIDVVDKIFPDGVYTGGASQLKVAWIEKGKKFNVDEYDGSESIWLLDECEYFIA